MRVQPRQSGSGVGAILVVFVLLAFAYFFVRAW